MSDRIVIDGSAVLITQADGDCTMVTLVDGDVDKVMALRSNPYTGLVEFTPSAEQQTVECSGYYMPDNITINPIPSNYGLITWNGSYLVVS